jgi:hypothetical protein
MLKPPHLFTLAAALRSCLSSPPGRSVGVHEGDRECSDWKATSFPTGLHVRLGDGNRSH